MLHLQKSRYILLVQVSGSQDFVVNKLLSNINLSISSISYMLNIKHFKENNIECNMGPDEIH